MLRRLLRLTLRQRLSGVRCVGAGLEGAAFEQQKQRAAMSSVGRGGGGGMKTNLSASLGGDAALHEVKQVKSPQQTNPMLEAFRGHKGTISLKSAGVSDEDVAEFIAVAQARSVVVDAGPSRGRNLRCLNLPGNELTDRSALALAEFVRATPSIRICNLTNNQLTARGVHAMVECVATAGLTALNLHGNPGWDSVGAETRQELGSQLKENRTTHQRRHEHLQQKRRTQHRQQDGSPHPKRGSPSREWKVAIIGGGIAGCALARALQQHGCFDCVVFEKDSAVDSRHQGYGLTIQQATQVC